VFGYGAPLPEAELWAKTPPQAVTGVPEAAL